MRKLLYWEAISSTGESMGASLCNPVQLVEDICREQGDCPEKVIIIWDDGSRGN